MRDQLIYTIGILLGQLLAAIVSYLIARQTASREVEKMILSWKHDETKDFLQKLSDAAAETASYLTSLSEGHSPSALHAVKSVAAVRPYATGDLAHALDALHFALCQENAESIANSLQAVLHQVNQQQTQTEQRQKNHHPK